MYRLNLERRILDKILYEVDSKVDARLMTLILKNIVAKSKEMKTGCSLFKSSKEGYHVWLKKRCLPMIYIMFKGFVANKLKKWY
jgi:hypothetical protein